MAASEYIMLVYWDPQVFNLKLSQHSIMSGRVKVRLRLHFMSYFNTWWGFESRMRLQAAVQKTAAVEAVEVTIIGILICDAGGGRTRDPGPRHVMPRDTWFVTEAAWRGPTHNNPAITMFCVIINDWFVSDVSSCQNVNSLNTLPITKQSGTWERPGPSTACCILELFVQKSRIIFLLLCCVRFRLQQKRLAWKHESKAWNSAMLDCITISLFRKDCCPTDF